MVKSFFRKSLVNGLGKNTARVISTGLFSDRYSLNNSPIIHIGDTAIQKEISKLEVAKHRIKQEEKIAENTRIQILILTYPLFKVALADSDFDKKEDKLLTQILINFLSEIYGSMLSKKERKILAELYIKDFQFIYNDKQDLNFAILDSLSNYTLEIKNSILELLIEMAEISSGISELEFNMIDYLTKEYLS